MYVNRHAIQCILGVWIVRESSQYQTRTLNTQIKVRNLKYENVTWNRWDLKFSQQ
jgi:hypothetical protein